jgi:hypothetical protein
LSSLARRYTAQRDTPDRHAGSLGLSSAHVLHPEPFKAVYLFFAEKASSTDAVFEVVAVGLGSDS